MATNNTKASASGTSGTSPKKSTGKRSMKKQVRRTIGGLFLASAIAVAAIPVEPTSAKSTTTDYAAQDKQIVRAVHYVDFHNNKFETIEGTAASDPAWKSYVPYIDANEQIYVDESMTYQFAFVKEDSASTEYYAVLLGAKNSAVDGSGNLTIPDEVDAYYAYASNTSSGKYSYCAVNKSGNYLYYLTVAQITDITKGDSYNTFYYNQRPCDSTKKPKSQADFGGLDSTSSAVPVAEIWTTINKDKIGTVPSSVSETDGKVFGNLTYGDLAYIMNYEEYDSNGTWIDPVYDEDDPSILISDGYWDGEWHNKVAYFPLTPNMQRSYVPCYLDNRDIWSPGDNDVELYYCTKEGLPEKDLLDDSQFVSIKNSTDAAVQRVYKCAVRYIGMQTVVAKLDSGGNDTGTWEVTLPSTRNVDASGNYSTYVENPEYGVFSNMGNLRNLTIGSNLAGIGDYAFYRCTALSSVTFSNQLNTIGNGAFKGCNNLTTVNLDVWTNLAIIGASAFENCSGLTGFDVPVHVYAIGDRAFYGCSNMTDFNMCGENSGESNPQMNLNVIGYNALNNCSSIRQLDFPVTLEQKMPVHYLDGCTSLTYLKARNANFDIIDGDYVIDTGYGGSYLESTEMGTFHHDAPGVDKCDIDDWIATLDANFYFEGNDTTSIHKTAKDHSAAFLYDDTINAGCFEVVVKCEEDPAHENTFVVDTNNNLVSSKIDPNCHIIEIPATIGGYGVSTISSTGFNNNCSIYKVYIPSTVYTIEDGAFMGCHNLQTVYFTEPYNYDLTIGDGAFDTQSGVSDHPSTCINSEGHSGLDSEPALSFVGAIDGNYAPFAYAMNGANNINIGSQPTTYITYYSGWPTFLQVQYNPDNASTGDENELIAYPTRAYLNEMDAAYGTSDAQHAQALKKYPFMSAEDFDNLNAAVNGWSDTNFPSGYTQDQVICANSIYDLDVPYGIESIKEGLFSNVDPSGDKLVIDPPDTNPGTNVNGGNKDLKSLSLNSIKTIDPYTFAGLASLQSFDMTGGEKIGDYAFFGCDNLDSVSISGDVTELGLRPFRECPKLLDVNFAGNNFVCDDAIIYNGSKSKVIQCLETRGQNFGGEFNGSTTITADEMASVTDMSDEAFMDCDHIETVELNTSGLTIIPEKAFAATDDLYQVMLPENLKSIKKDAFLDSNVRQVSIPSLTTQIQDEYVFGQTEKKDDEAYEGLHSDDTEDIYNDPDKALQTRKNPYMSQNSVSRNVTFFTPEGSAAENYANDHKYINANQTAIKYKVTFRDPKADDPTLPYDVQEVESGAYAQNPKYDPDHPSYTFQGWSLDGVLVDVETTPITGTTTFVAMYEGDMCTVTFYDYDFTTVLDQQTVAYGGNAATPPTPHREGYAFLGWLPEYTNVTSDLSVYAQYEKIDTGDKHHVVFYNYDDTVVSEQYVADGEAAQTPSNPTRSGYKFTGWKPSDFTNITHDLDVYAMFEKKSSKGGDDPTPTPTPTPDPTPEPTPDPKPSAKKYTVTVVNGSGSGTYEEGSTVIVTANDPAKGKVFDKWTTGDVTLASTSLSATTFKMPGKNVTVTANYKDGNNSNAVKTATGNASRPPMTGSTATGSTQVQVNKGGVSNVDLATATVRGSKDSFVVKVTETNEATNAVENALNNRYGGLDSLHYWPCDISLYDSTGTTKITDATGLSVEITLPIPDQLRGYGGNNRVAAVANNQLEDLSTKFNTVNGTPTVTFTATHFSPYVIYVDSNNLNASQMLDASPKTGDPIHPKWFFAIGLASASVVLFLKKDKKTATVAA